MMRPTGSSSSYLVLSGQNLELECIVQGLQVKLTPDPKLLILKVSYLFTYYSFSLTSPSPSIQWIRKDGVLSESRTTKDSNDRVLRFQNISETDGGEYQCTATNPQGMSTHTYRVTVEGTVLFTLSDHFLCTFTFRCRELKIKPQ